MAEVEAAGKRPLRVLLAEDSEDDCMLILRELRRGGYDPLWERVEARATMIAALESQTWDIVLADFSMPSFTGLEALAITRERAPDMPFILVSGTVGEETAVQAMKAGAHDYLMKGQLTRLVPAVERELREAGVRREQKRAEAAEIEQRTLAEAVRDVAAVLNRTLDFDQVLRHVLEGVGRVVPHDVASVALVEHGQARVVHRLSKTGEDVTTDMQALRLVEHPLLQKMYDTGEAVVVPDTTTDSDWRVLPSTDWVRSYTGIPLLVKEQVIGFLSLHSKEPGFYSEAHARHLQAFADQAATAIENSRLYEATLREAARAEALARVAARLNAQLDVSTVLDAVCEEAAQALGIPAAAVALHSARHGALKLAASTGLPRVYLDHAAPMLRETYDEMVERHGPDFVVPDSGTAPGMAGPEMNRQHGLQTQASARMMREGILVGALNIVTLGAARRFGDDELALLKGIADQAAQAITNARLFSESQARLERLQSLRAIDLAITASLDLQLTLKVLLEQVTTRLGVHAADVLLLRRASRTLAVAARRGFRTGALLHTQLRLGQGHAGQAALERRLIHIHNLAESPGGLGRAPLLAGEVFVAYMAVPLVAKAQVVGVLEIFHRAPLEPDEEWLGFLETLAGQAAIAIDNATLLADLQQSNLELSLAYEATLEGWSKALDLRDRETEGHTLRVTDLTLRLAGSLDMSDEQLAHIRRGALLHDIGKMGIPDSILLKPGPLDDAEWQIMRRHPTYAHDLLSPIPYLRPALDIPYCHHEKWDGTGYPRGLRGPAIPVAARLFAVVDVWDALLSDRPYRSGWPEERVRDHILREAGRHFDPKAVETLARVQGW